MEKLTPDLSEEPTRSWGHTKGTPVLSQHWGGQSFEREWKRTKNRRTCATREATYRELERDPGGRACPSCTCTARLPEQTTPEAWTQYRVRTSVHSCSLPPSGVRGWHLRDASRWLWFPTFNIKPILANLDGYEVAWIRARICTRFFASQRKDERGKLTVVLSMGMVAAAITATARTRPNPTRG
eukprot:1183603-Prorocentrum_minimum.AAC.2